MDIPPLSIIGPGNLGKALARAVQQSGLQVHSVLSRNPVAEDFQKGFPNTLFKDDWTRTTTTSDFAPLIYLTVPDDQIRQVSDKLSSVTDLQGKHVMHCSGTHPAALLDACKQSGAQTAAMHPNLAITDNTSSCSERDNSWSDMYFFKRWVSFKNEGQKYLIWLSIVKS